MWALKCHTGVYENKIWTVFIDDISYTYMHRGYGSKSPPGQGGGNALEGFKVYEFCLRKALIAP